MPDVWGTTLNHPALLAGTACILGSQRTVVIGGTAFGRLPPSGHCIGSRLRYTLSFSVKRPLCLYWSFGLGAGLRSGLHLVAYGASKGTQAINATLVLFSPSPACRYLPERCSYTRLEPDFLPPRGHTSGLLGSGGEV